MAKRSRSKMKSSSGKPDILRASYAPILADEEATRESIIERIERLHRTAHAVAEKFELETPLEAWESEFASRVLIEWAALLPDHPSKRGNPRMTRKIGDAARKHFIALRLSGKSKTAAFAQIAEREGVSIQAVRKALSHVADAFDFARQYRVGDSSN